MKGTERAFRAWKSPLLLTAVTHNTLANIIMGRFDMRKKYFHTLRRRVSFYNVEFSQLAPLASRLEFHEVFSPGRFLCLDSGHLAYKSRSHHLTDRNLDIVFTLLLVHGEDCQGEKQTYRWWKGERAKDRAIQHAFKHMRINESCGFPSCPVYSRYSIGGENIGKLPTSRSSASFFC